MRRTLGAVQWTGRIRLRLRPRWALACVVVPVVACATLRADEEAAKDEVFEKVARPFLESYCLGCHSDARKRADLSLETTRATADVIVERSKWERVIRMLDSREMPPSNRPQPDEGERLRFLEWARAALERFDCTGAVDPGRVTLRRLNREEYDNTVRDLLGVEARPGRSFPADDTGYGFDNIGDVLSLPPLLFEKYLDAAATIAEEVFGSDPVRFHRTIEAETIEGVPHATTRTGILVLGREAEASAKLELPASGLYLFRARAAGEQAGPDPARMELRMNGEAIASVDVTGDEERFATFEATVALEAGEHRAGVAYMNNWNDPNHPDPALRGDRNLLVDRFELQLLLPDDRRDGRAYAALVPGRDAGAGWRSASLERVEAFARRAFRRPLADGELDRIEELFEAQIAAGDSVEIALRTTVEAILVSPRFIFRMEDAIEPELAARHGIERPSAVAAPLDPHSVASRLSYFLWSSMPDDELLRLADSGELVGREVLESQVRRMLADPRSRALVENFGGQWLQTRFLREVSPDPELFPGVDRELLRDMETETLLFFESIVREDRSVLELLDGSYTFLNERLARHYGLSGVEGPEFRRVSLEGNPRGGILTQASFLTITSNPTRTSPVKRGLWVLERLLDMPPPPPPPDTPELSEEPEAILSGSLRQRFEKHRADPACASCHERMDPIGFAFENFDAVGRWREFDGEFLVDSSGTLPDGRAIDGAEGLKKVLLEDRRLFLETLAEKMLTYALGRGLEYYDKCAVDGIVDRLERSQYRASELILGVVTSLPFLHVRDQQAEVRK